MEERRNGVKTSHKKQKKNKNRNKTKRKKSEEKQNQKRKAKTNKFTNSCKLCIIFLIGEKTKREKTQ